jgi:hypothetical protein
MTEWTSVKDRLPEPNVDVLGWCTQLEDTYTYSKGEKFAAIESYCLWKDFVEPSFRNDRFFPAKVTHWMPLPAPPKDICQHDEEF